MHKILLLLCGSLVAAPTGLPKLVDVFSPDLAPGSGRLSYRKGSASEKIDFGTTAGHYAMGVYLKAGLFPESFRKELKEKDVIQVVLGTFHGKSDQVEPQFSAITVPTSGLPAKKTAATLVLPKSKDEQKNAFALMLFSSPSSAKAQSDEDKLKNTFFANGGTLHLTPKGQPTAVQVKVGAGRAQFQWQEFELVVNAKLVTPFSPEESSLVGTVNFPIYWPASKAAEELARQIAETTSVKSK